jgi:hypothetical protein
MMGFADAQPILRVRCLPEPLARAAQRFQDHGVVADMVG